MSIFKIIYAIKKISCYVLSAIAFPQNCISCGQTAYGIALCTECKAEFLESIEAKEKRCTICGRLLLSEKETCLECRENEINMLSNFTSIFPIHPYVLWKIELLFAWKSANARCFTPFFAETLYTILQKYYSEIPIIPVPPRQGKIKKKGWDQIQDLCIFLEKYYNATILNVLKRETISEQKKLSRTQRLENSKNYTLTTKNIPIPKEAVLIDDVMTTGATLKNCSEILKKAGVERIHAVTLFYVP